LSFLVRILGDTGGGVMQRKRRSEIRQIDGHEVPSINHP
jgi:hypothetical protein